MKKQIINKMKKTYSKILKIKKSGKSDVFDFTVKNTHRILANNFYTSNCSIKHPDAEDFIDAKLEQGKVTGANISVKITDEFMDCVINDKPFKQQFPIDSDNPKYVKEIDAKKLWNKIVHNAWKSAEPGILFWDNISNEAIPDMYGSEWKTVSTNPCLTGDSKIMTSNGEITIKEIFENFNNEKYEVLTYNENTKQLEYNEVGDALLTKRNANIIELELEDGELLRLTPEHKVFTENRGWVEAAQLTGDDILLKYVDTKEIVRTKIKKINIKKNEDVYDLKVYKNHNFFANKILVHNCGEIPLCPYDSCRLLALNLYSYVNNPFTKDAEFNFSLFKEHVIYSQRFMDDIVDLEIEKVDAIIEKIQNDPEPNDIKRTEIELWYKIKEKAEQGRRTGLGITAEGDMLAALGFKYGTEEATNFSEEVHKLLAVTAYESSIIMAKERGAFKVWDFETEINNPFIQRIWENLSDEYKDMMKEFGRRNISLLTVAPTGSVSIMTQTTSGIEPVFLPAYMRRRKINPNDKSAKSTFVDEVGDHWEEYPVFHPKFKIWAEINGHDTSELEKLNETELNNLVKMSPYYGATANDVDWVEKVRMQGKIQKWVDHSISVTVNLPNNVTEELVGEVYKTGWESGCKGITVYRDGSRSGVLVSKTETKKTDIFGENDAPKRPENLPCDVMRFTIKGERWIGFLGLYDNRPYEIYTGLQEKVNIPNYVENGVIRKIKTKGEESRYDFIYTDKDGYQQEFRGLNRAFNREYWNVARMLSAILRHGMPLLNVMGLIDKLDFGESDITSWKNGIKRMIKKYVKDGTKVKGEECPNCGSHKIIYKEGCKTCLDCNWSKCE